MTLKKLIVDGKKIPFTMAKTVDCVVQKIIFCLIMTRTLPIGDTLRGS